MPGALVSPRDEAEQVISTALELRDSFSDEANCCAEPEAVAR
jgi:hypothetical protein